MQKSIENIFSLVSEIMKLEEKYEKTQENYNHLVNLFNRFGKNNKCKMSIEKYECENLKKKIDDLIYLISKLELVTIEQTYYNLYKEKSQLTKKSWECVTEAGYINSSFIFDCACDDEIDNVLSNKRKELKKGKELFDLSKK